MVCSTFPLEEEGEVNKPRRTIPKAPSVSIELIRLISWKWRTRITTLLPTTTARKSYRELSLHSLVEEREDGETNFNDMFGCIFFYINNWNWICSRELSSLHRLLHLPIRTLLTNDAGRWGACSWEERNDSWRKKNERQSRVWVICEYI